MKDHLQKTYDGFTLIEIISALALVSVVILTVIPFFPQVLGWSNDTEDQLVANYLVEQVANDVKYHASDLGFSPELTKVPDESLAILPNYLFDIELYIVYEAYVDLYQINIQILNDDGDTISESYTYVKGEG